MGKVQRAAVQLFADDVQATTSAKRRRADVDARATLAMAAGAALFVTTVAVEDDSETLRNRIAQLLITAVAASHPQ